MSDQWDQWMRLAQAGDKPAYKNLLLALRPWLVGYFAKRVPSAGVEDLVQETMICLHEKRHTYDPALPLRPWLATIARYRWADYMRKVYRRMETPIDDDFDMPVFDADATVNMDVLKLLRQLSPAQAEMIDLVKLKELSIEEAARQTGRSQSSVKVIIHRGLKKLAALARMEGGQ